MLFKNAAWSAVSTPSAMMGSPSDFAMGTMAFKMPFSRSCAPAPPSPRKRMSSLIMSTGTSRSMLSDEYPAPKSSMSTVKPWLCSCAMASKSWGRLSA